MKVNMTPNPLDVVTIHASQGDTEARQWEFELHNNGELIDTSDVKEQLVFKAYKGGTEQLLPENTSTPTTSPFLGDIRYPQGLLTDQEFTYRQSPTIQDGLARIDKIKGNTLVWNQQVSQTTFPTLHNENGLTITWKDSSTINISGTASSVSWIYISPLSSIVANNHVYLITTNNKPSGVRFGILHEGGAMLYNTDDSFYYVYKNSYGIRAIIYRIVSGTAFDFDAKINMIDLTLMFGETEANRIYALGQQGAYNYFHSLFPLSYYAYNQGSLLSFNGNGIKTVGKNLFDFSKFANGAITFENGVLTGTAAQFNNTYGDIVNNGIDLKYPNDKQITISFDAQTEQNASASGIGLYIYSSENGIPKNLARTMNDTDAIQHITVTIPSSRHIDKLGWSFGSEGANIWHITNFQVEFGTETEYEPYTSSTLSLPISTYFPDGMQGHGDTYDELTSAVATKGFEKDSLGDLTWTRRTTNIFSANLPSEFDASKDISCFMSNRLPTVFVSGYTLAEDGYISIYKTTTVTYSTSIYLNMASQSIDTVADLQTWLSNNPTELVYPLATPTETSFTTASLVTENAEIPLSNNDGTLIGKCTEELSAEPGFHDAKIKLSDSDGECYSNKIQLHVERSPQ